MPEAVHQTDLDEGLPVAARDALRARLTIVVAVVAILAGVVWLYFRAAARVNQVALTRAPKPVSVQAARKSTFRPGRTYVGTINPWNFARVGPQHVAAYVGTVLVRPGAQVKRGDVLATLDCRSSSAASKEIAARARALEGRQVAAEHEAGRVKELGEFASANELEKLTARSASEKAEVESLRASLVSRGLEVDDCVLRAPFTGEVSDRHADPGAYVRPGNPVVSLIDRTVVRIVADAPESDYAIVAPGTPLRITVEASAAKTTGTITRRTPAADDTTRTVHFEIDLPNQDRALPVGTTARLTIDVGAPQPATAVALRSATLRGDQATLFAVEGGKARRVTVRALGELGGVVYLDPKFAAGTMVVVEGRALLEEGDAVTSKEMPR